MKKLILIVSLFLALPGCNRDSEPQPQIEPHWLRITYDGDSVWWMHDSIDVAGWEPGEETIYFWDVERGFPDAWIGYHYPWQGEDSIDYVYDDNGFLWVNGKLVAGSYNRLVYRDDEFLKDILVLDVDYSSNPRDISDLWLSPHFPPPEISNDVLNRFPSLSRLHIYAWWGDKLSRLIDTLPTLPQRVELYLLIQGADDEHLRAISELPNLRELSVWSSNITNRGILYLANTRGLKELFIQTDRVPCLLWSVLFLRLVLPDCTINTRCE